MSPIILLRIQPSFIHLIDRPTRGQTCPVCSITTAMYRHILKLYFYTSTDKPRGQQHVEEETEVSLRPSRSRPRKADSDTLWSTAMKNLSPVESPREGKLIIFVRVSRVRLEESSRREKARIISFDRSSRPILASKVSPRISRRSSRPTVGNSRESSGNKRPRHPKEFPPIIENSTNR